MKTYLSTQRERELAAFEDWLETHCPSGDCDSVHSQWLASCECAEFESAEAERPARGVTERAEIG